MRVSPFSLTPSRTSEVSVPCNNSVGSQRSASHCAFCGEQRRAAPLCLPSAAPSALAPLPSKRGFPPQPGLQASAPSAGGLVPSRFLSPGRRSRDAAGTSRAAGYCPHPGCTSLAQNAPRAAQFIFSLHPLV